MEKGRRSPDTVVLNSFPYPLMKYFVKKFTPIKVIETLTGKLSTVERNVGCFRNMRERFNSRHISNRFKSLNSWTLLLMSIKPEEFIVIIYH